MAFLIVVDFIIYAALSIALMNYDDKHDDSEVGYGSWKSMTTFDKTASALMISWNIVNLITAGFVVYAIYKKLNPSIKSSIS
ncbi:hypothetical protein ACFQ48_02475 [Hymenobacter caeli]|uniref:DUF1772 domain-containing protein n=1 Tax=Hymenobacter caeli TaxID=2735894 RepID=A0ABX2FMJ7_9BACT|nr:hypothetical protein [Hymenobacter caeli]NRT17690.1 hypothetical protein [Hymenobacter caeli]